MYNPFDCNKIIGMIFIIYLYVVVRQENVRSMQYMKKPYKTFYEKQPS